MIVYYFQFVCIHTHTKTHTNTHTPVYTTTVASWVVAGWHMLSSEHIQSQRSAVLRMGITYMKNGIYGVVCAFFSSVFRRLPVSSYKSHCQLLVSPCFHSWARTHAFCSYFWVFIIFHCTSRESFLCAHLLLLYWLLLVVLWLCAYRLSE